MVERTWRGYQYPNQYPKWNKEDKGKREYMTIKWEEGQGWAATMASVLMIICYIMIDM